MQTEQPVELYIHIPFCVKKCNYCDFLSYAADDKAKERYVEALCNQIGIVGEGVLFGQQAPDDEDDFFTENEFENDNIFGEKFCETDVSNNDSCDDKYCGRVNGGTRMKVSTVYFGGGTPTTLLPEQIERILTRIREKFDVCDDAEITIEVNPGTAGKAYLARLFALGFNRLSIGLQSANEDELKLLGRIHTYEEFAKCYEEAKEAGFNNINVDVMTALPGQDEDKLLNTLNKVIALNPEHVSAYSLIIEEGTPFYEKYGDIEGPVVGEEAERRLYYLMRDTLKNAGYDRYEISNFAKPGYESRHNMGYWRRIAYFGLGLGASSFYDNVRVAGTESITEYFKDPMATSSYQLLTQRDAMEEFMFLGLRTTEGVTKAAFSEAFHKSVDDVFSRALNKLICEELLEESNDGYRLTDKGIDYGNYAFSQFLM